MWGEAGVVWGVQNTKRQRFPIPLVVHPLWRILQLSRLGSFSLVPSSPPLLVLCFIDNWQAFINCISFTPVSECCCLLYELWRKEGPQSWVLVDKNNHKQGALETLFITSPMDFGIPVAIHLFAKVVRRAATNLSMQTNLSM